VLTESWAFVFPRWTRKPISDQGGSKAKPPIGMIWLNGNQKTTAKKTE